MKGKKEEIFQLALPAAVENILHALVGFVDTWMISKIGLIAVTAVGMANNLMMVYLAVFTALGTGTSSLIARSIGAGKKEKTKEFFIQSTVLAILSGAVFGIASLLLGGKVLEIMGAEGEVLREGKLFLYVVGSASVFISLLTSLAAVIRASRDTKTPMIVNTLVNIFNVGIDYILIFGWGIIPPLGVLGTAIGTVISRALGCFFMFQVLKKKGLSLSLREIYTNTNYKELIFLSIPAALERLVMRLGQVLYYSLIAMIGIKTYAAHVIAGNIESFFYMPAYGLSTAAAILMGNCFGRKDKEEGLEYLKSITGISIIIAVISGMILYLFGTKAAFVFTEDLEAVAKITTALRVDAFAQIPLALGIVFTGALQGIGDTKTPLYSTIIGVWGLRVVGIYVMGMVLGMDILGVWLAIAFDLTIRAAILFIRLRKEFRGIL
ncbi:MATE family efflux transporter [Gallicola sp. Sow4_E12]|uniref:MATE family efflux transporter n=1 Tax=Gallicola sp. Sow4_E12 TaxID=3438785 RepID=UPI003F90F215